MKKLIIALLVGIFAFCLTFGLGTTAFAESATEISTADELLAIDGTTGNYILTKDIVLPENKSISKFYGTLDGNGYSVTINNKVGFIDYLGKCAEVNNEASYTFGVVKNLTVKGTVNGTGGVAGVANHAVGLIKNVRVEANISSTSSNRVAGIANCDAASINGGTVKLPVSVVDCTFAGSVQLKQGFKSASNYTYWGMFLGYNGGAFGQGYDFDAEKITTKQVVNCYAEYTLTVPTAESAKVKTVEFFNSNPVNGKESEYKVTTKDGYDTYTFKCVVNKNRVDLSSIHDEGIMANYGTPVVRITLTDGTYRYLDGFDKATATLKTNFGTETFDTMYEYVDISNLKVEDISSGSVEGGVEGGGNATVQSTYSTVVVNTEAEFESFARIINSAVPASFKNAKGETVNFSILDTLAISVKLGADIVLDGDDNGNASEFFGLGKQEFFPYRGGVDGDGHSLTVNMNAPNGYCIGIISVASEISEPIVVKDLTVKGSIVGKTKVGIVGYYDMVCNNYLGATGGGDMIFENVTNEADITGYTCVGGLLGAVSMSDDGVKTFITGCENTGDITVTAGGAYGGGIVGCAGFYSKSGVNVKDTKNSGNVTAEAGADYVGGIAGIISDDLSSFTNVTSTGTVAADDGKTAGDYIGKSGVVMGDLPAGSIGNYTATTIDNVKKIAFKAKDKNITKVYDSAVYTSLVDNQKYNYIILASGATANYTVKMVATDENGRAFDVPKTINGYFLKKVVPGTYTLSLVVTATEGFYTTETIPAEGITLADTATLTVTKASLEYAFKDAVAPYTGKAIDYFKALENDSKYNKTEHEIPSSGAKWVVEYYKSGSKVASATEAGVYDVKIKLEANDDFNNCYAVNASEFTAKLTVQRKITVTVNSVEITKGEKIAFTVKVTTSDGSAFNNVDGLGLVYEVEGRATSDTSILDPNVYTVLVSGAKEIDGCTVEYVSGKLTVKKAAATNSGNGKGSAGCGGSVSGFLGGCLLLLGGVVAVKGKKND